ncbi:putative RNA polymerase ECF-type sigma factor [Gordonia effusa NBRC 100432]|uniref:Putative RNA polymerase ECF-type sigma factor n=1 Tax=Gordonia effusa NBRC 100432 TaxID=1077974 RepID=H0R1I1_9ACTN|nr:sigma-70 family RNA polymerase sigma factor [Gordonia effusa]GAB18932.1 putative RNA polymerase ECF-type sigma factor [Gordonia effusa NBRC 100432]
MEHETARTNSSDPAHTAGFTFEDLSDDELAGAAAVGDRDAFAVLVTRLTPVLLRYLRRMVSDQHVAEDLAQETLLHAWKGLPDFAFRSSFRTWVFSIGHRKAVDHYRRRRDVPTETDDFAALPSPAPEPAESVEHSSLREALTFELSQLSPAARACWWLREVEGLSLDEIASVLRITPGSARGHLQRSRKQLAERLDVWRPGYVPQSQQADPQNQTSGGEPR